MTVVHILFEGRAMCGQEGLPCDWPEGHKWVALNDPADAARVNCAGCTSVALRASIPTEIFTNGAQGGKYGGETSVLLQMLAAEAVLLVVKQGVLGDGFAVACDLRKVSSQKIVADIPRVLRDIADDIEQQEREKKAGLQ